jgi:hypothetical protein
MEAFEDLMDAPGCSAVLWLIPLTLIVILLLI